jgi:aryl-alcohol dehydrogenase-like predicted oxidoreductase
MRYKPLGRTGLFVSELCLGTMTFGGSSGIWAQIGDLAQADADTLIGQAVDAGINFIDTADIYAAGVSEQMTGQALKNLKLPRDRIVLATKVFGDTGSGPNQRGASRSHILDGVKASLQRLQMDHIDLYQIHGFDPATPIEETLRALDTLVRQGHVRYVGVSNWAAWQIVKALGLSERLGLARFESLQAYYTVAGRDLERELLPMLASEGLGLMVWSPLAGGLLSGKFGRDAAAVPGEPKASRRSSFDFPPVDRARAFDCIDAMRPDGGRARQSRWRRSRWPGCCTSRRSPASSSAPSRPDQLADNLAAASVRLTVEEQQALDLVSRLPREYPGWMLERQGQARRQQLSDAGP